MNWQAAAGLIAAYAALFGGIYAVVTRPIENRLNDMARRLDAIEARLLGIENRLTSVEKKIDVLELKAWR